MDSKNKLLSATKALVDFFSRDGDLDPQDLDNFKETPQRVAKMWCESTLTKKQIAVEIESLFSKTFPVNKNQDGMIIQGPILSYSFCPHHLLPVKYESFVAYIPSADSNIIGLSKIARAVNILSKRPVLHEQLAMDVADVFYSGNSNYPGLGSEGSAVLMIGRHSCMEIRGIKSSALTSIVQVRGIFKEESMEDKFNSAVQRIRESQV